MTATNICGSIPTVYVWSTLVVVVFGIVQASQLPNRPPPDEVPKVLTPLLLVEGKTVAEVLQTENGVFVHCSLIELEEESDAESILKSRGLPFTNPPFKEMLRLINDCSRLPPRRAITDNSVVTPVTDGPPSFDVHQWKSWALWNGILPGTKWCGVGDIASNFQDLGTEAHTDACCRAHDHCPVKLKALRKGYGIRNYSLYTKSHCDCDREFYNCLKEAKHDLADAVGRVYFNAMRIQCLKPQRPFICIQNRTEPDGNQNCVQWGLDMNSKKMQITTTILKY